MFLQGSVLWHPDCRSDSRGDNRYRRSTTPCLHYLYPPAELQATRSSTESISSRPTSSLPTSPGHSICAKVDDQVVDYRDLAALPRVKTILDIERPDLLSYGSSSYTQNKQSSPPDRPLPAQVSPERRRKGGGARSIHRHSYTPTVSPQHFHRPDVTSCLSASMFSPPFSDHFLSVTAEHQDNLYMKPPIYKQHDTPLAAFQTSSLPGYGRHSSDFCQLSYGDTTDGPTGDELRHDLRPAFSHLDRGLSLPNLLEHTFYPYEVLAVTSRGRATLPKTVDRTRLECYLSPDSFYKVFEMDLQDFNQLPLWKRNDLKKIVNLF